jgi:hypothetical protein
VTPVWRLMQAANAGEAWFRSQLRKHGDVDFACRIPPDRAGEPLLGWPLARRRVPPNRCLVLLVIALGLSFVRGLPELGYIGICMAVFVVGSIRATVRGIRVVKRRSVS